MPREFSNGEGDRECVAPGLMSVAQSLLSGSSPVPAISRQEPRTDDTDGITEF